MKKSGLSPIISLLLLTACNVQPVIQNPTQENATSSISQNSAVSKSADGLVWKNEKLGYEFLYPHSSAVSYSEHTPDGACTYVSITNASASLTISFIDSKALSAYPGYGSGFFCHRSDAPLGMKGDEVISDSTLDKEIRLTCFTHYDHDGEYKETPSNAAIQKDCKYTLMRQTDSEGYQRSINGSYLVSTDYGKTIPMGDVEKLSAIAHEVISSFKLTKGFFED